MKYGTRPLSYVRPGERVQVVRQRTKGSNDVMACAQQPCQNAAVKYHGPGAHVGLPTGSTSVCCPLRVSPAKLNGVLVSGRPHSQPFPWAYPTG